MKRRRVFRAVRTVGIGVVAAAACAVATTALGCGAATVGLGSLGLGAGALAVYLLFAAGGGTACSPRGPVGACLSIAPPPSEDAVEPPGPCLQPLYPCLQPPYPYPPPEPCLEYAPVEPYADECLSIAPSPCLSMPAPPADAGTAGPEDGSAAPTHLCLFVRPLGREVVRPGAETAALEPRAESVSARRLAAAGVLTEDQLRRLARLRGEG